MGHRPTVKGGYFPVPPVDSLQDIRSAICLALEQMGVEVEVHHHEVANAGQSEIGTKFAPLVQRADWLQILKYAVHNTAHAYGKTATFMPKPIVGDNGSGMHVHQSIWKDGKNLFAGDGYAGLSEFALYYIGGIIKHAKALNAITNPGTNSYKRLVPGFEAPINLAYSARNRSAAIRIPYVANPKGRRIEVRFPDPTANPYLAFSAMLMAGLDGVQNKIHPGDPMDKNLYDLEPEEAAKVPHPCASLDEALDHLDKRPRVPDQGRRVHRRHDRRVHRAQDGRSHALPDDDAPGRVRHVLQPVTQRHATRARRGTRKGRPRGPPLLCLASDDFNTLRRMPSRRTHRAASGSRWPVVRARLRRRARSRGRVGGDARREGEGVRLRQQADVARRRHVSLRDGVGSVLVLQRARRSRGGPAGTSARKSAPQRRRRGFPRVDPDTQKGRDDVRRKVLADELATEEKLLAEARVAYADGAPAPLPEERADAEKYRARIARLRQAVDCAREERRGAEEGARRGQVSGARLRARADAAGADLAAACPRPPAVLLTHPGGAPR